MTNIGNFKLIAHRGLLEGPSKKLENDINLIKDNIKKYPYLINELDLRIGEKIFVGHEVTDEYIEPEFLIENTKNLILHIKQIDPNATKSIKYLNLLYDKCHLYSHDADDFAITNNGWIWLHPRLGIVPNTICVMPETFISLSSLEFSSKIHLLSGVCTDYPLKLLSTKKINF